MGLHKAVKDAGISNPSQSDLFKDFYNIQAICTHPSILSMKKSSDEKQATNDNCETEDESYSNEDEVNDSDCETSSLFENSK